MKSVRVFVSSGSSTCTVAESTLSAWTCGFVTCWLYSTC